MTDIERAREGLAGNTVCLVKGGEVYKSDRRGIAPLLRFIASGTDFTGFSVADKIVGRAAALLYAYMGVTEVYAEVLSRAAQKALIDNKIAYGYGTLTDRIVNRSGDGLCPMEEAVMTITDPSEALEALKMKLKSLQAGE